MAGLHRKNGPKVRHKARIWGVYVTPAKRAAGIARRRSETLLDRAGAIDGLEQVLLSVTTAQVSVAKLYRSLGFESFGCEPRALKLDGKFIDEEYLAPRLKRPAGD
jgi:ribosomal protein S18 acetylase RimI-like enzyme